MDVYIHDEREEENFQKAEVHEIKGMYTFQIDNYSGLSDRVGAFVESPNFFIGGHEWKIRIFPGGSVVPIKNKIFFFLYYANYSYLYRKQIKTTFPAISYLCQMSSCVRNTSSHY